MPARPGPSTSCPRASVRRQDARAEAACTRELSTSRRGGVADPADCHALGTLWPSLQEHGRSTETRTSSQVTTHIAKAVRVPPNRFHIFPAHLLLVDRMWHNP